MDAELITEKLSFQVKSFQESFEILSSSSSIIEMAKHFNRILRGSFFSTDISIFYKKNENSEWERLIVKAIESKKYFDEIKDEHYSKIYSIEDSTGLYTNIQLVDSSYLGVVLGKRIDGSSYSEIDKITFQIYLQMFDSAYQAFLSHKNEKNLIFSLNSRVSQLYSLIETGIEISKINLGDKLLKLGLSRAISLTNSSFGRVKISYKDGNVEELFYPSKIVSQDFIEANILSHKFIDYGNEYEFSLCEKESREGVIDFDETDDLLLSAIVRQVHAAIENERFHKEALENETMRRELAVASAIQKRILPEKLPNILGYDIAGINIPSKEVSGDYYNVFQLEDGRFALVVADVTGKGMPASLLVSTLDASLRSYLDFQIPLSIMALKMNSLIFKSSTADKFITFFIAILNPSNGELDIINAGHNPSLFLRNNGNIEKIYAGGVAFGMFDMGLPFESQKLTIEKGERLFIFTDGIPEAMDKDENEYTDERMEKYFNDVKPVNSAQFISSIVADVKLHTKGETQSDDITAIYLIRKE